jgi:hypothetical protein
MTHVGEPGSLPAEVNGRDIWVSRHGIAMVDSLGLVGRGATSPNGYWTVFWGRGYVITFERGAFIARKALKNPFRCFVSNSAKFAIDCTGENSATVYVFDMHIRKLASRNFPTRTPMFVKNDRYCVWLAPDLANGRHFAFDLGPTCPR